MSLVLPSPMKAVSGTLPHDDEAWGYEIKWDGMRILVAIDGGLRGLSATGRDVTGRFPELAPLGDSLSGHRVGLDGEVVALRDGRPDFGRLQHRMHIANPAEAARRAREEPLVYLAFDLLHLDGIDTLDLPYLERRRLLGELVEPGPTWQVPAYQEGQGAALLALADRQGLEGVMAKRLQSRYEPGRRSGAWRKVKVRRRQELVVGGWTPGEGRRGTHFGALLVGYYEPGEPLLHFSGGVGTGFSGDELDWLQARLDERATDDCPFHGPLPRPVALHGRWVRPELVAEVEFGEWTAEGRLRHPSYVGLRDDKEPTAVVREPG